MPTMKRVYNILRYGVGPQARERKEAHKTQLRQSVFSSTLWQRRGDLAQRHYESYEEYRGHQVAKLDKIVHRLRETEAEDFADFRNRFQTCEALVQGSNILCLGARLGTEVRALHSLGYFAVGIDLNPGVDNPYVLPGDFHALVFPDSSVDAVYTNALDHVFDLAKVVAEVRRLLRPGGIFIADMVKGYEEGFLPGNFEATHWRTVESFANTICGHGNFTLEGIRDLGQHRRDCWQQVVMRKTA